MLQKISEGVVQGIVIAAIGFSAATVWTSFQKSTDELKVAKKQFDLQIVRNQNTIDFNEKQKQINSDFFELANKQTTEISKLSKTIKYLNNKVSELSKKARVAVDATITNNLDRAAVDPEEIKALISSVRQSQETQNSLNIQMQQQQVQQQQQQLQW